MDMQCEQCKYFEDFKKFWRVNDGCCHRYPPKFAYGFLCLNYRVWFPGVNKFFWCGEFKIKEPL